MQKTVHIYTDGGCKGNPGPGGWAALLVWGDHEKELTGFHPDTTNNRMELQGAIEGIRAVKKPSHIHLFTDSIYVKKGITEWVSVWEKNGWKTANKKPVKNEDLWKELTTLARQHTIEWFWIKGHNGHPENERVDALLQQTIKTHIEKPGA